MAYLLPAPQGGQWSPSSRRAWIEIRQGLASVSQSWASPSSRRAWIEIKRSAAAGASGGVALLAEGVDRNTEREDKVAERNLSPSSRRAWIEIGHMP